MPHLVYYRITEWLGMKGTSGDHPAQRPARAGSPTAGSTVSLQAGLNGSREGDPTASWQPVPGFCHPQGKDILSHISHSGISSCISSILQVWSHAFLLWIVALNKTSKCMLRQGNTNAASAPLNWNTRLKDQKLLWLTNSILKCFLSHKLRAKIYKFVSWSINLDLLLFFCFRQMACRGNCRGLVSLVFSSQPS